MAGQPARWVPEGSPRDSMNQLRTMGWNWARASDSGMQRVDAWRVRGELFAHHLKLDGGGTHRGMGGWLSAEGVPRALRSRNGDLAR